jgi:hypothetical protein
MTTTLAKEHLLTHNFEKFEVKEVEQSFGSGEMNKAFK